MNTMLDKIKNIIKGTKFDNKVFLAGGYVRDMIMGIPNHDFDFCVELPNGGIELANFLSEKLNGTNVVIFERFGTAQVVIDGNELEFVMTRKESYLKTDRNPNVIFGTINDDVQRRDFTINSLLLNISTGQVIDLTGGVEDIKKGIIRTTSDPSVIFEEDPLRILRAVRFSSRFGFDIEHNTFEQMKILSHTIENISRERIRDEFMKSLSTDNFERALDLYMSTGLIFHIGLPELAMSVGMEQNYFHNKDVYGHTVDVMRNTKKEPLHRLAAMLHDIGKVNTKSIDTLLFIHFYKHELASTDIADRFMRSLKFSNDDIELVSTAVRNHMRLNEDTSDRKVRSLRCDIGDTNFDFLLDLCEADRLSHTKPDVSHIERFRNLKKTERNIKNDMVFNGDDIMCLFGLTPGKKVGELLNVVKELTLDNPDITKEEVIEKLLRTLN